MLKDIIQESPLYELARAYGEARGEARGEVRGEARGEARGLRNACLTLTKTKAPRLAAALEARLSSSTDIAQLEKLLVDLGLAQNEEAVQSAISHYVG
jgi:hypothetical protein